jgi:hypothetical protein
MADWVWCVVRRRVSSATTSSNTDSDWPSSLSLLPSCTHARHHIPLAFDWLTVHIHHTLTSPIVFTVKAECGVLPAAVCVVCDMASAYCHHIPKAKHG